ncbi:MAG: cation:proton antiporter subunit C [Candidatus Thermoplasmatota archaeon]|nr:cation:proton antiporter subunit C [Candidatus Thermoplasmatota archaeon]
MMGQLPFLVTALLIGIGLYICLFRRNIIKIIMGVSLMSSGVNLFLVSLGYTRGGSAPIFTQAPNTDMVMPTTQALTLTSIVIGVATTALMLAFAVMIYKHYKTLDANKIRRLKG